MPTVDPKKFGGASIDIAAFEWLRSAVPEGGTILELGSGHSTEELCKFFTVISVEDNEEWVGIAPSSTYIHAPPKDYRSRYDWVRKEQAENPANRTWYDPDVLRKELPKDYDLLLIDGPYWSRQRIGFVEYMDLFRTDCAFLIDDAGRKAEGTMMRFISEQVGRPWEKHRGSPGKEFGTIPAA